MFKFKNILNYKWLLLFILVCVSCFVAFSTFSKSEASIQLFVEPEATVAPVLNAINDAQKSIEIEVYMLTNQNIIDALINKARNGVKVKVILEHHPYGGDGSVRDIADELNNGGVKVHWGNKKFTYTHEKAIIIDGVKALIMTLNLTNASFVSNREYGLIDTNLADVKEIRQVFDCDWNSVTPKLTNKNLLWSPVNSRDRLVKLIKSAKHTLSIETEGLADLVIEEMLVAKAKEGVDVKLIISPPSDMSTLKILVGNGVQVHLAGERKSPNDDQLYMHAKMMVVDGDKSAYVGSENLTKNSLDFNRELGIKLSHSSDDSNGENGIIKELNSVFEVDWANTSPLT